MSSDRIVIVGAGHAGGSAAAFLRQNGFEGRIELIGEEAYIPYQRPPLSKAFLKNPADVEALKLRPDTYYHSHDIVLRLGERVASIDTADQAVVLEHGDRVGYDKLILATGSAARRLDVPGHDLSGIHYLRSIADAVPLANLLHSGRKIAIIGAGYVGLEVAASARSMGADAIVIEREERVLARVAHPILSDFFTSYHRGRGVEILCGAAVESFAGDDDGWVAGINLADGRRIDCNAAVIGVGGIACMELAASANLECANGIVVDDRCRTSDPNIYAIGDVTWRPMPLYDDRMFRLESVPNALEQAKRVACELTGRPMPADEVPWFWSDQFDLKLQIVGIPFEADDVIVRGDMEAAKFALFHVRGDEVMAVEAVNSPAEFMAGRQLTSARATVDRGKLADKSITAKELVAASIGSQPAHAG